MQETHNAKRTENDMENAIADAREETSNHNLYINIFYYHKLPIAPCGCYFNQLFIQQRSEAAHPATAPRSFAVLGGYTLADIKKCECSFKMAQGHIMVSLDVHLTCPTAHMVSPASMMNIHNEICSHLLP